MSIVRSLDPTADRAGAQAYARYTRAFTVAVGAISQAEALYQGQVF